MAYSIGKKVIKETGVLFMVLMLLVGSTPAPLVFADEIGNNPAVGEDGTNGSNATNGGDGESTDEETDHTTDGSDEADTDDTDGPDGTTGTNGNTGSTTSATSTSDGLPASVETGDAHSEAVNQNEINVGDTDVTTTGSSTGTTTTTVTTDNSVVASSSATSSAQTGENMAADPDGAIVRTGDADAFGMLVSMFNIAITNSSGSILFLQNPLGAALDLTDRFMSAFSSTVHNALNGAGDENCSLLGCSIYGDIFNAVTNSVAEITNNLVVRSATGGNAAQSEGGDVAIETGDAHAFGSVINFGNLQIIDSRYLVILLNNFGTLDGDVVLPTPDFFKTLSSSATLAYGSDTNVHTENTADITNNGTVGADSGENTGTSTEGTTIDTGDATAGADVQNFVNGNSLGGRPVCFIVSVGGTWRGRVIGLPDGFESEATPFGQIICGAGSGESRQLSSTFNATTTNYAKILNNVLVEAATGDNEGEGETVDIETGDADAFMQILNVANQNIIGQDWVFALITVSEDWNGDLTFGSDEFWNDVNSQVARARGGGGVLLRENSKLKIQKEASVESTTASSSVDYTITIKNTGGPIYNALLVDTISSESGEAIHENRWGLGTVQEDETITVSYSVFFNGQTLPGTYTNKAFISGTDRHPDYENNYGHAVESPIAQASIEITGEVLGLFDGPACDALLTSYMKKGALNDETQVRKLQRFLIEHENASIAETGIFDAETEAAVRAFQVKYASDVLIPWGIPAPTGYVYYTTQKKINELYCNGMRAFDLSPNQAQEIERYRMRVTAILREDELPIEVIEEVGQANDVPPVVIDRTLGDEIHAEADAIKAEVEEHTEDILSRVRSRMNDLWRWVSQAATGKQASR